MESKHGINVCEKVVEDKKSNGVTECDKTTFEDALEIAGENPVYYNCESNSIC
jgi:hypothetical protein